MIATKTDSRRFNRGTGSEDGLPILHEEIEFSNPQSATIELWNIYDKGEKDGFERWRLSAAPGTSVLGKANYALAIKDGQLWSKDGASALKEDRPELFKIVSDIAATGSAPEESLAENDDSDPYGDAAVSKNRKLTQLQQWNRSLLEMRIHELHWECRPDKDKLPAGVVRAPSWEQGVRQAWFGCFRDNWDKVLTAHAKSVARDARLLSTTFDANTMKPKPDWNAAVMKLVRFLTSEMPQTMLDDAIAFITARGPRTFEISYEEYSRVMKECSEGKYKPMTCAVLAAQLDVVAGVDLPGLDNHGVPLDMAQIEAAFDAAKDAAAEELQSPNDALARML